MPDFAKISHKLTACLVFASGLFCSQRSKIMPVFVPKLL
ncbi:hypothetical protein F542_20510 [Bibersteinia trehalosi USDA-ARS-USMARC-188]|uniref:Uncharacterized protein n=1 Tax=Bibersteinia trehalosi USDA-ARS-USMARC-188 TaxID=1263829 RepID=A0A4V7ICE6_BIBTR|nr:hypothetical protein WQG_1450 [Bibersteinia trehalosi USDA-ARS-USMARC-192]AHG82760.1 hypothetical protein F542_20510 [Bibersteinia trehalosi USDA-ARS-USMARC-188]